MRQRVREYRNEIEIEQNERFNGNQREYYSFRIKNCCSNNEE